MNSNFIDQWIKSRRITLKKFYEYTSKLVQKYRKYLVGDATSPPNVKFVACQDLEANDVCLGTRSWLPYLFARESLSSEYKFIL
jgi:hypothetical protein